MLSLDHFQSISRNAPLIWYQLHVIQCKTFTKTITENPAINARYKNVKNVRVSILSEKNAVKNVKYAHSYTEEQIFFVAWYVQK